MPDASSAETAAAGAAAVAGRSGGPSGPPVEGSAGESGPPAGTGELPLSIAARAVMMACGFIPLLHLVAALVPLVIVARGVAGSGVLLLTLMALYLLPATVVGVAVRVRPLARGAVAPGSAAFLWWWFTAQWQVLFARLPCLEELLRVVPGLYSLWLRIWGARVGSLVYWSPGVSITDRSLVRIGDRVVFGLGVRLNPHVMAPGPDGRQRLYLAPIQIGSDALVGGYSLVLAGCQIAGGEATPPLRTLHAFTRFAGGGRLRREGPDGVSPPEDAR